MNFLMEMEMPVASEQIWPLFFDLQRVAGLIPGCSQVEEKEALSLYSAVMRQKIGPFKFEVPAEIRVEQMLAPSHVRARASGRDKFTGTTVDMLLDVTLTRLHLTATHLRVESTLQVAGKLAALGYPVVKNKSEELFAEFAKRLRAELGVA